MKRPDNFDGLRIFSPESRHADTMAEIIGREGGVPLVAPAMREIPLENPPEVRPFLQALKEGTIDVVLFLTGVGARALAEAVARELPPPQLAEALAKVTVVARGPKPVVTLRQLGIRVDVRVPEPNTWREILASLDEAMNLGGKRLAVQEYGISNPDLIRALEARGAQVMRVPIYRWALPEDLEPLRSALREIAGGSIDVALFTNATQVDHVLSVAREEGIEEALHRAMRKMVVASVGPICSGAIRRAGWDVDFEPSHSRMVPLVRETARRAREILEAKRESAAPAEAAVQEIGESPQPARDAQERLEDTPFMRACRRKPVPYTPIWIMRQAGRYMREYREVRAKVGFLELCKRPDLVCEVTVTAVERLGVDAAIIFSDILLPLEPMGAGLEFSSGEGPVLRSPVRSAAAVDDLHEVDVEESLPFVFESIRVTRAALKPDIPLIGFAGAPFTLASYVCEGGGSRNYEHTKTLMYRDPGAWRALMEKLVRTLVGHLNAQIAAGTQAVQLFDSWVGALSPDDYRAFVLPYTRQLIEGLTPGTPVIHFGTGTAALLEEMREAGGDVIGLDWRVDLGEAWARVGYDRGVQGNLDPLVLFASPETIRARARRILDAAAGRAGHIFNLGHGILPQTSVDHAIALVDAVHEESTRRA
jgi:uroporphyrinogen decarboxylase